MPLHGVGHDDMKGHVCPPSTATHPSDRWETLFVYSFIVKFTHLRGKDGLNTVMDFEDALLHQYANPVMTDILTRFILNLRSGTRNIKPGLLNETLAGVLAEHLKTSEMTVFWNDALLKNVNPLTKAAPDFFVLEWDTKLKILRYLVELQLVHSADIKAIIDRAWGITQNKEKRKGGANVSGLPNASDPYSQDGLNLPPAGQDASRKRYWFVDDSPRLWTSSNPWKTSASFQCISSTRDEYIAAIEQLKASKPTSEKKTKQDQAHIALIEVLEARIGVIDHELARIARARKKVQQKQILLAQAELRTTRTRRQTRRPDYYRFEDYGDEDEADDGDAYKDQPEADSEPDDEDDGASTNSGLRRSGRTTGRATNGSHTAHEWRGERRSTRLGASINPELDGPPPAKRSRTVDSATSEEPLSAAISGTNGTRSAASLKPTETAVEQLAGKKKNKFWFYAVEPIVGAEHPPPPSTNSSGTPASVPAEEEDDVEMQPEETATNGY